MHTQVTVRDELVFRLGRHPVEFVLGFPSNHLTRHKRTMILWLLFGLLITALTPVSAAPPAAVAAPVLKWQYGGCQEAPHYCETGWYASPAVADLDGNGRAEVLWGAYSLFALNGSDGSTIWRARNGSRIWPGVALADLEGNGDLEIVVGRGADQLTVYDQQGNVQWSRNPFGAGEVRSLAVADLDGDGPLEVIVGRASGGSTRQVHVFEADGHPRMGWPARRDNEPGEGWGMYNENLAIADLDANHVQEIYAPTDTHYITALYPSGNQISASAIYGANQFWSQVGVHVDHAVDLRGYANCGREHRPNFANVAPASGDLDGDGTLELVLPGDVYNCDLGDPDGDLYYLPWVLRGDRTRWQTASYDWTVLPAPAPNSGPLSQDYNRIENIAVNTVLADLDGDGRREILFPSYDGRLHAYWLDKSQHGAWPFDVPGPGIRFASEPVVVDLDADGRAEVLFSSWPEKGTGQAGQLHLLDDQGRQLYAVDLPTPGAGADWNGGLSAPTLANLDADPDLELVLGTSHSGAVAYDLPGSAGARILWGSGRGGYQRTGAAPATPPIFQLTSPRTRLVAPASPVVSFNVQVEGNPGPVTLSLGQVHGPAPLPTARVEPASLNGAGTAVVTLTASGAQRNLAVGIYSLTLTVTGERGSRSLTLRAFIGGSEIFVPLLRRL